MTDEVTATLEADLGALGTPDPGGCAGGCACGEGAAPGLPQLDVRGIPHAIRHGAVLGALDAIGPGDGLVLIAPHDPQGLLARLEQQAPDAFDIGYLERGPEVWRLSLIRKVA